MERDGEVVDVGNSGIDIVGVALGEGGGAQGVTEAACSTSGISAAISLMMSVMKRLTGQGITCLGARVGVICCILGAVGREGEPMCVVDKPPCGFDVLRDIGENIAYGFLRPVSGRDVWS